MEGVTYTRTCYFMLKYKGFDLIQRFAQAEFSNSEWTDCQIPDLGDLVGNGHCQWQ